MNERQRVLIIGCHPDDIEINMSGTAFRLRDAGCEIIYMTLADGSCGSGSLSADRIAAVREMESRAAAAYLGSEYRPSLAKDMLVFYEEKLLRQLTATVRDVAPDVILTHSPQDYMEDHMATARLVVSAAFARGMANFSSVPERAPIMRPVTIYHAMPHGLRDQLRSPVIPDFYVDVTDMMIQKRAMLAFHASQKEWLDQSQGFDSYIDTMADLTREMGLLSGHFQYAEGWRRHLHLGFAPSEMSPLESILREYVQEPGIS
jgi:LmbE family N-acetylglucosaminyl deacetylase